MVVVLLLLCGIVGYLLGSINASVVVGKFIYHKDVREHGSKNAGLTNTLRVLGKQAALMVLAGDILKGVLACLIGSLIHPEFGAVTGGFFAVIGHNWPLYFGFKGGKGVLTTATVVLMLDWKIGLICLLLFVLTVLLTKYVSLGSMLGAIGVIIASFLFGKHPVFIGFMILLAILVIIRHKANIKRLISGTENKLTLKKGSK